MKRVGCLLILGIGCFQLLGAEALHPSAFTKASDIRRLSPHESGLGHPASIKGVVTFSDPRWNLLFVQDDSAGIFVSLQTDPFPSNSETVEITGETGDGSFLPVITKARWRHLGMGNMPEPRRIGSSERFLGELDSQWSELVGVIQQVTPTDANDHLQLELAGDGWHALGFLPRTTNSDSAAWEHLVDVQVRVSGVFGVDYDDKPGKLRLKIFIPSADSIQVIGQRTADPFSLPYVPLAELRATSVTNMPKHRVHIRGMVTCLCNTNEFVLQEQRTGLRVQPAGALSVKTGDSVEAIGFVEPGTFSPVLKYAVIRPTASVVQVTAVKVPPAAVLWGDYDADLLEISGSVQSQEAAGTNQTLVLLQDGILFGASLPPADPNAKWPNLRKGSSVRLTGVCSIRGGQQGAPQYFGLHLRAPDDLAPLPATWVFSGSQLLEMIVLGLGAWGLVLLWGATLKHQVSEKTKEVAKSLSLLAAAMESTADGVLVIGRDGRITRYNETFCRMWGVERQLLESGNDAALLEQAALQLTDSEAFVAKVRELYQNPEAESFDILEFKDGREFERYSQPQRLNGQCVGRVWCFRDVTARKKAETECAEAQGKLLEASHRAGMAEVATSVLHNVGNVLNSVNVSVALVQDRLRRSRVENLTQAATLIGQRMDDLPAFFAEDPRGEKLRGYLKELSTTLVRDNDAAQAELKSLRQNIEHIKTIVAMQQVYAGAKVKREWLDPKELMEQAVQISLGASDANNGIELQRDYQQVGPVLLDRHKVLQILINLLSNARHALNQTPQGERRVTLGIFPTDANAVCLSVTDSGIGIPAENLGRVFKQGFTTKSDGHGFGLHSSAKAAQEMSGSLSVQSDGVGKGASFLLKLPANQSGGTAEAGGGSVCAASEASC